MILQIEDSFGNTIGATFINENDEFGNIKIEKTNGLISIADIDFDDIFNTNEYKVRIQLIDENILNIDNIANSIITHILSTRSGEIYDEEIAMFCIDDYFADIKQEIFEIIDKNMIKHYTKEDNLTII